jgi:hypothetical protein
MCLPFFHKWKTLSVSEREQEFWEDSINNVVKRRFFKYYHLKCVKCGDVKCRKLRY